VDVRDAQRLELFGRGVEDPQDRGHGIHGDRLRLTGECSQRGLWLPARARAGRPPESTSHSPIHWIFTTSTKSSGS
jgi:hypothetical protein